MVLLLLNRSILQLFLKGESRVRDINKIINKVLDISILLMLIYWTLVITIAFLDYLISK
jgi:hypothetical protein